MRHARTADVDPDARINWRIVKHLIPYLLESRYRVILALACLVAAKGAILTIPFLLKHLVDSLESASAAELAPAVLTGLVLAYGCRGEDSDFGDGRLVELDGDGIVPVPIEWLEQPDRVGPTGTPCGWLAGQLEPTLDPGLWRFEPPASLNADPERGCELEFRVAPKAVDGFEP